MALLDACHSTPPSLLSPPLPGIPNSSCDHVIRKFFVHVQNYFSFLYHGDGCGWPVDPTRHGSSRHTTTASLRPWGGRGRPNSARYALYGQIRFRRPPGSDPGHQCVGDIARLSCLTFTKSFRNSQGCRGVCGVRAVGGWGKVWQCGDGKWCINLSPWDDTNICELPSKETAELILRVTYDAMQEYIEVMCRDE